MSSALVLEANAAYDAGDWDQAIEGYTKALEADTGDAEACRRLADTRAIRGNLNLVVETYLQLMDILCSQNNYEAALQVGDWVKCIKPESDAVRAKTVDIYIKLGDMAKVVQHSMELARLYIELGQGESAISLLVEAQKTDPGNLEIGLELAETYVSQGHIQEGANQYRKMGHILMDGGNLERSCEAFRRLKLIQPDDPGILLTLGNIYVELRRYNEAEQEYRSILRHNLNHEEALLALGRVCQLKCQWRDAILAFNRILNINPNEITAKERLGELYQQQSLIQDAIKYYLLAAQAYFEIEERDKAIRLYQIVLGLDHSHPTAVRELTNLEAPLMGIRNENIDPPPSPTVDKVEAQEGGSSVKESSSGIAGGLVLKGGDETAKSGMLRRSSAKGAGGKGLLSSKPKIGEGKPTMGAQGGSGKVGLFRAGGAGGGDKPMLSRRKRTQDGEEGAESASQEVLSATAASAEANFEAEPAPPPRLRESGLR